MWMISSFCRSVNEICALLGLYAAQIGRMLQMFWDNLLVPTLRVKQNAVNTWLHISHTKPTNKHIYY